MLFKLSVSQFHPSNRTNGLMNITDGIQHTVITVFWLLVVENILHFIFGAGRTILSNFCLSNN